MYSPSSLFCPFSMVYYSSKWKPWAGVVSPQSEGYPDLKFLDQTN